MIRVDKIYLDDSICVTKCIKKNEILGLISDNIDPNNKYYVLEHRIYGVYLGVLKNKKFIYYDNSDIDIENLIEIRIFNNKSEIRIVKNEDDKYIFRKRQDGDVVNAKESLNICYDEKYLLYGTKSSYSNMWTTAEEKRGIRLNLPFKSNDNPDSRFFLKVRNYVDFTDRGLLKFEDSRLCGFSDDNFEDVECEI